MAEVMVTFKVMPTNVNVNLAVLEGKIKNIIRPERIEREPIAFGLVALKVIKIIPDEGGVLEEIENKIKSIENVGEVEVVEMGRTL
jgi:elongation factor 1-beta